MKTKVELLREHCAELEGELKALKEDETRIQSEIDVLAAERQKIPQQNLDKIAELTQEYRLLDVELGKEVGIRSQMRMKNFFIEESREICEVLGIDAIVGSPIGESTINEVSDRITEIGNRMTAIACEISNLGNVRSITGETTRQLSEQRDALTAKMAKIERCIRNSKNLIYMEGNLQKYQVYAAEYNLTYADDYELFHKVHVHHNEQLSKAQGRVAYSVSYDDFEYFNIDSQYPYGYCS